MLVYSILISEHGCSGTVQAEESPNSKIWSVMSQIQQHLMVMELA